MANEEDFKKLWLLPLSFRWHAVAQLIEALRYKPEDRGFHSRWCYGNFFT
jgi:hypothetical protein